MFVKVFVMEIDHDYLKKLEDNIVNTVQKRVEGRLFRKYLAMGGFVAAVTAFFGWSLIDSIDDLAMRFAKRVANPAVLAAEGAVADATESALAAKSAADTATLRIDFVDKYLERREDILFSVQLDTTKQLRLAEQMQLETQEFFKDTRIKSQKLDATRQELSERFAILNEDLVGYQNRIEAVSIELNKLASAGDLETVATTVDVIGTQLAAMNEQLNELVQKASTTEALIQQGADSVKIDSAVALVAQEKSYSANDTTVYFQFAGSTRELAVAITSRLKVLKYVVPGAERTFIAAGKHEIRYYFEEDIQRAALLKKDINATLLAMGLESDVKIEIFTDYQGAKPRRGTLELWLEPKPL